MIMILSFEKPYQKDFVLSILSKQLRNRHFNAKISSQSNQNKKGRSITVTFQF